MEEEVEGGGRDDVIARSLLQEHTHAAMGYGIAFVAPAE